MNLLVLHLGEHKYTFLGYVAKSEAYESRRRCEFSASVNATERFPKRLNDVTIFQIHNHHQKANAFPSCLPTGWFRVVFGEELSGNKQQVEEE